ncbi:hypothetical protein BDZ91DRAFT_845411 [Kalaharituber pfeilii]|nr:hypothetical protein BDZ91DRAFT_845411 [Kalaharituber pfeilii]
MLFGEQEEGKEVHFPPEIKSKLVSLYHTLTTTILTLLPHMLDPASPSVPAITLIATFSDPSQPWTNKSTQKLFNSLLCGRTFTTVALDSSISHLLSHTIKPLFLVSSTGTAAARLSSTHDRAAMPSTFSRKAPPPPDHTLHPTANSHPWIYAHPETVTILHWVLSVLQPSPTSLDSSPLSAVKFVPLLLPPLLTLLDGPTVSSTATKCRPIACGLLRRLVLLLPETHLAPPPKGRGLGSVIWDAVFPFLHWIPPVTPVEESEVLLKEVYPTLVAVARGMYKGTGEEGKRDSEKLLDRVVREGVASTVGYVGENMVVVRVLLDALVPPPAGTKGDAEKQQDGAAEELGLIKALNIYTIKHLPFLIPFLVDVMRNPFSAMEPSVLIAAVRVMIGILTVGGGSVRLRAEETESGDEEDDGERGGWKWEILGACIDCWGNVVREEEDEGEVERGKGKGGKESRRERLEEVKRGLRRLMTVLKEVVVFIDVEGKERGGKGWEEVRRAVVEGVGIDGGEGEEEEDEEERMRREKMGLLFMECD